METDQIMFKMLFKDELYDLNQVRNLIKTNPNVAWVVYSAKKGTHR